MKPLSKLLSICTLLVLLVGCSPKPTPTPTLPPEVPTSTRIPPTQTTMPPTPSPVPPTPTPTPVSNNVTVSYLEAADWLIDLAEEDRDDQILDWTMLGMAGVLQLDTETLRDAFYDQVPVRDPLFSDMAANRSGLGRGLPDGRGGLNVLVPVDDPHASRTIAMVLDDYRKDAGADPQEVALYRYKIDHGSQSVALERVPPRPTDQVRKTYGYLELRIDTLDGLKSFLGRTQHLSRLEIRDGQLWAGGWNWPGVPAGPITPEDITVLQRGYLAASYGGDSEPGFSLDPGEPMSVAGLVSLLDPVDYPELAQNREIVDFLIELDEAETADLLADVLFSDFVMDELLMPEEWAEFESLFTEASTDEEFGIVLELYLATLLANAEEALNSEAGAGASDAQPNSRKLGSVLVSAFDERTPYQAARYDGGLQGTEAGMTYFYTDLLGKAWLMDKGTGAPVGIVPGFVTDVKAKTPWSHCKTEDESGRLWFGLREETITLTPDRVDLGSISTRVFTLIDDPSGEGVEIEPSFSFGRIIWWWDDHYLPMADYEPQYHRLDQLMRWGAAIAWLVNKDSVLLPELPDDQVKRDWRFGDWLKIHPELKWQYDIPFVEPPGETTEALLTFYSEPVDDCGGSWVYSGGISNPTIQRIVEIQGARPVLNPSIARAGLSAAGTDYSLGARSGAISTLDGAVTVKRVLGAVADKAATVDVSATGRKVWSLANVKAWVNETASRHLSLTITADDGQISQHLSAQGLKVGELTVIANAGAATVRWHPNILDRIRRAVNSLQDLLPGRTLQEATADASGAALVYTESDTGRVHMRVDDPTSTHWATIEKGLSEPGDKLAFRLGMPGVVPDTKIEWYTATVGDAPKLPPGEDGTAWLTVKPNRAGVAALVEPALAPSLTAGRLIARYVHQSREGTLQIESDRRVARADDPVFGLDGTSAGLQLMSDLALVERTSKAQKAAQAADDGCQRAIPLADDSILLAGIGNIVSIVPPGDPWYVRVSEVIRQTRFTGEVLIKVQKDQAKWVAPLDEPVENSPTRSMKLSDFLNANKIDLRDPNARGPPIYLETRLANQMLEEIHPPPGAIGVDPQVRVVVVRAPVWTRETTTVPDIWQWDRSEWIGLPSIRSGSPGAGGTGGGVPPPSGTAVPARVDTITLVYLADDCNPASDYDRCD